MQSLAKFHSSEPTDFNGVRRVDCTVNLVIMINIVGPIVPISMIMAHMTGHFYPAQTVWGGG